MHSSSEYDLFKQNLLDLEQRVRQQREQHELTVDESVQLLQQLSYYVAGITQHLDQLWAESRSGFIVESIIHRIHYYMHQALWPKLEQALSPSHRLYIQVKQDWETYRPFHSLACCACSAWFENLTIIDDPSIRVEWFQCELFRKRLFCFVMQNIVNEGGEWMQKIRQLCTDVRFNMQWIRTDRFLNKKFHKMMDQVAREEDRVWLNSHVMSRV
jgi:hypothetical protein